MVASASAMAWYICCAARLSRLVDGDQGLAAEECWWPPSRRTRPRRAKQHQADQQGPQRGRGAQRRRAAAAGRRPAGRGPAGGRRGARRAAPGAGQRGGHEPISAICCLPRATRAPGSGWKPYLPRYPARLPVVIAQRRKP